MGKLLPLAPARTEASKAGDFHVRQGDVKQRQGGRMGRGHGGQSGLGGEDDFHAGSDPRSAGSMAARRAGWGEASRNVGGVAG